VNSTNRRPTARDNDVGKSDCERTFARATGNDEVAPLAVIRGTADPTNFALQRQRILEAAGYCIHPLTSWSTTPTI